MKRDGEKCQTTRDEHEANREEKHSHECFAVDVPNWWNRDEVGEEKKEIIRRENTLSHTQNKTQQQERKEKKIIIEAFEKKS